ncbi:hypothetical protein KUC_1872 [Vreelandella boliviensis LC1]|uniref:Uncharacterized protein n=1 Tax=Vreelandella boliviensis LC1 TaxID=1072583 RepID=A0A7U9C478_9GAMM|nr:hypothetical protein KUC_1872 [Halomonas boliviensis LC1]
MLADDNHTAVTRAQSLSKQSLSISEMQRHYAKAEKAC